MELFTKWQQLYDEAVSILLSTEDVSSFDLSHYGKLVDEYGKLLKHYRQYRNITESQTGRLDTAKHELLSNVHFDVLTGIFNHGYLNENLERILLRMNRAEDTISVMLVDIDYFKQFNDSYGSDSGDDCLRYVAETLKSCLYRGNDFVARYGGEEFMIIMPATNEEGARMVAERILKQIKNLEIPNESSQVSSFVTVSIGVVTSVSGKKLAKWTCDAFFNRAEEALYQAKDRGRNQYAYLGLHS